MTKQAISFYRSWGYQDRGKGLPCRSPDFDNYGRASSCAERNAYVTGYEAADYDMSFCRASRNA